MATQDQLSNGRDQRARIVLRPLGTPIALGLAAILLGTTMLSGLQLGWLDGAAEQRTVAFVALVAAFPLELLAATLAFLGRDPLVGTGLGTFSSVWSVAGLTLLTGPPGGTNDALGMYMLVCAVTLALLIISAGRGRVVFGVVMACGCIRLAVTGLYELIGSSGLELAAGVAGLLLAVACAYGVVAVLSEDLPGAPLLPVGRSGRAESSLTGSLEEQLHDLEHEAGVRRQL